MARSYDSRRFPAGPYLEPTVQPALRGPKRTGPIGELVPGDDIEVARILARLGRRPRREPIVFRIKLSQDGALGTSPVVANGVWFIPVEQDMDLLSLVRVELACSTVSSSGPVTLQLQNVEKTVEAGSAVDLLETLYPVVIDQGDKSSKDASVPYRINWANSQVRWGDQISVDLDTVGTGVKGLDLSVHFR